MSGRNIRWCLVCNMLSHNYVHLLGLMSYLSTCVFGYLYP
jgi:hypothetical protein